MGSSKHLVPIRTVSQLTGVNPVTLRAWERRYGLIKPERTPKGHRLYSRDDIDLIHRILALLDRGMSIGQVRDAIESEGEGRIQAPEDNWSIYRSRMLAAIMRFDEASLDETYNEALALYPVSVVTSRLIVPLLEEIGARWERGEGSVAEEHFFGCYLRNKLGARFHHRSRHVRGPRLLLACMPGEYHEIGLLLFALTAASRGYDIVLLGANMPLDELPDAVQQARCDGIVLSGSTEPGTEVMQEVLPDLVRRAPVPVFVGGQCSNWIANDCARVGATALGADLETGLRKLAEVFEQSGVRSAAL